MQFKDLKIGLPIYLLDRMTVGIKQGKVTGVLPRMDYKPGVPNEMVVDVTMDVEGNTATYTFKDTTNVGYTQNLAISPDKEAIVSEIEAIKQQSDQAIAQHDFHVERSGKCAKVLVEFNPALKEKRETEERFRNMETTISELKTMLQGLVTELKG